MQQYGVTWSLAYRNLRKEAMALRPKMVGPHKNSSGKASWNVRGRSRSRTSGMLKSRPFVVSATMLRHVVLAVVPFVAYCGCCFTSLIVQSLSIVAAILPKSKRRAAFLIRGRRKRPLCLRHFRLTACDLRPKVFMNPFTQISKTLNLTERYVVVACVLPAQ